jgi:superfamily II DNA or RNA helicase
VDKWLDVIEQEESSALAMQAPNGMIAAPSIPKNAVQNHIVYIFDVYNPRYEGDEQGFYVTPMKARLLKKGGYGKEYRLRYSDIENEYSSSKSSLYFKDLDEDILMGLRGIASEEESNYYSYYNGQDYDKKFFLQGELGDLIFKQILRTKRCFWQTQRSPILSDGGQRELFLSWKEHNKTQLRMQAYCDPNFQSLMKIDKLHYIDTAHHQCGYLYHASLSEQQILYFLSAPPIPKEDARAASERLLQLLPDVAIPLPEPQVEQNLQEIKAKPAPCLLIHAQVMQFQSEERLTHLASLSFDYDGISYQAKTLQDLDKTINIFIKDSNRYKIYRDIPVETQAINFLHQKDLIPFSPYHVCDFIMMSESLYDTVTQWDHFLENTVPQLQSEGWQIVIDDSFNLEIETIDDWYAELDESENGDWFEMTLGFELNGKPINMLPLLVDLLAASDSSAELHQSLRAKSHQLLQLSEHQWVKIPTERILRILDTIVELYDTDALSADGVLSFSKHAGLHYSDLLNDPSLRWKGADELRELSQKLANFSGIEVVEPPHGLQADLRGYQQEGLNWLQFLRDYQLNAILADDMGLGKTIQALSNLLIEKQAGRAELPSLVIAPTSLMSNWKREIERFTPELSVLVLQGAKRKERFAELSQYNVILSTYPLMIHDKAFYEQHEFHYLILDEAQAIKNAKSKTTQIIYALKANHRLCLTGTPIENHLGELWSMYHFLMPGYLGTQQHFTKLFKTPIEKQGDNIRAEQLRKRVQPFMLRRTKDLVAKDLPKKTEIIRTVPLLGKQRDLYETVRLAMDKKVRAEISKKGLARSQIMILDALLKLRQVCCDPQLVKLTKARSVKESAKLDLLMDMLPEMVEEGRKILLFSQFVTMLGVIENKLKQHKISYSKLTGKTRKREEAINAFQEGDAKVFLISLKAGGVGLNLTAADTVIHYDPWWNPAVERQATDRAHRIGQDKPVFVYKLLTEDTVEEKILKLQEKKQALADNLYGSAKNKKGANFGQTELMDLLKPVT